MTYGLIGEKLGHSYSKVIHESLGRYDYNLFSFNKRQFEIFMTDRKFSGLNITIPYKKAVIPFCDQLTDLAHRIGAVNTLYFKDGLLWGTNTDYLGFLYAAKTAGISFKDKKVLILGNGGTSLMVRTVAADHGASQILVTSRRGEPGCIAYENLPSHTDVNIIINTTPVGTYPNNGERIICLSDFPQCSGVVDVIYNPFSTDLIQQAQRLGIAHTNGLPMLVAQATAAAEFFLGETGFQRENSQITRSLKRQIENIVLIGMPGCGKSSFGKALAKRLKKKFVDMDHEIEAADGREIPTIFQESGESYFRKLETKTAQSLGKEKGQIIATGGGVVLCPENMKALSQNGTILFIQRPIEKLATDGRPLSKDINALKTMYEKRLPLYNKYSQLVFTPSEGIEKNMTNLLSLLENRN